MYLVVPADKTERIRVYCAIPNEETYELEKGELLGESSEGKPFLLLCNVSEIIPNVILETANLNYSPCLSGEDGELVENDAFYDFSPYGRIKEFFDKEVQFDVMLSDIYKIIGEALKDIME